MKCNKIFVYFTLIIICMTLSSWAQAQKRNYAVIGLKNAEGVSSGEAEIIADRLRIELFNTGGANMMERDQMQDILSEQGFQASGACTDEACMIEIGQLLGVERLISGSIGKLGSMFLLNFRAIDVQTAKIIAVVSKDISGGIEDVVKHLPDIARELVEAKATGKPVETVTAEVTEPEPVEPKVEEAKPEVKAPEKVEEKEPEVEVVDTGRKGKNKNRSGVRLSFNLFPGGFTPYLYEENEYVESKLFKIFDDLLDSLSKEDGWTTDIKKYHLRAQVDFMIKAGPFIIINIGPGLTVVKQYYKDSYNDITLTSEEELKVIIIAPNISSGINFVLRFYPLKINAGFLLDVNFNISRYTYDYSDSDGNYDNPRPSRDFTVNLSLGPRVGLELLAGKHFGFSLDYIFKYSKVKSEIEILGIEDEKWMFKLPGAGFGAGVNFYF